MRKVDNRAISGLRSRNLTSARMRPFGKYTEGDALSHFSLLCEKKTLPKLLTLANPVDQLAAFTSA